MKNNVFNYQNWLTIETLNRVIPILILIGVILLITFLSIFVFIFWNQSMSSNIETWAHFGDTIGGVLNPILTLINICLFVYLTKAVQDGADVNNLKNLQTSKQIALMSLKHEEFTNFTQKFDRVFNNWHSNLERLPFLDLKNEYMILNHRLEHLFPYLQNSIHNIEIKKILDYLDSKHNLLNRDIRMKNARRINEHYNALVSELVEWTVS